MSAAEQAASDLADLTVPCPACRSAVRELCTTPTDTARRPVRWTHNARHDARMGWNA